MIKKNKKLFEKYMQRDVVSLIDICASKETNMRKDPSKYFVPGTID